jgi:hypothetical protein
MSAPPREEEFGGGERSQGGQEGARPTTRSASEAGLIVWVVTRKIEHETIVLGVKGDEAEAARLVDDDIENQGFPKNRVVRYHVQSHAVT